jgi:hypothetical protein
MLTNYQLPNISEFGKTAKNRYNNRLNHEGWGASRPAFQEFKSMTAGF